MGFRRRAATTGKVHISEGAKKEAGLLFHHEIASVVEKYNIPPELVINSDQTPSKYVTAQQWRQKMHQQFHLQVLMIKEP